MNARITDPTFERHPSRSFARFLERRTASAALILGAMTIAGIASCVPQNQAEVDQLRAQLQAVQDENAQLRAQLAAPPQSSASPTPVAVQPAPAQPAEAASASAPEAPPFEESWKAFEAEKRDAEWAVRREKGLLDAAKEHIAKYGASINSVRCKTTICALVVDVPEKPKAPYVELANPWAETRMSVAEKPIYAKQTRYTYLLHRHTKDYPSFAEQRVDPLALAKSRAEGAPVAAAPAQPATPAPVAQAPAKPAQPAQPAAAKPTQPAAAKPAPAPAAPSAAVQPVAAPAGQPPPAQPSPAQPPPTK